MSNLEIWEKVSRPPKEALKQIQAGRLKGMSDVNPQWRLKVMTEQFGLIGIGWNYEIDKTWTEPGTSGEVMAFVQINLFIKVNDMWSQPIIGIGGSALIAKESAGLRANDEAYKMALTDALSVAMKQLGIASAIYEGLWDGSKYKEIPEDKPKTETPSESDYAEQAFKDAILDCNSFREFLDCWSNGDPELKQRFNVQSSYKAKFKAFSKLHIIDGCTNEFELTKFVKGRLTDEEQDAYNKKLDSFRGLQQREI